jgi:hypothetical protein
MTVFGSFISLKTEDQRLILKSFFLNYYMRFMLWLLPFQHVQKIVQNMGKKRNKNYIEISHLMWAINTSSSHVFRSTCLTRALTAQILLYQNGYSSTLLIGVTKNQHFEAHAWVEYNGNVVMGKSEKEFIPIIDL